MCQRTGRRFTFACPRVSADQYGTASGSDQPDGLGHSIHSDAVSDQEITPCLARTGPALFASFIANSFLLNRVVQPLFAHAREAVAGIEANVLRPHESGVPRRRQSCSSVPHNNGHAGIVEMHHLKNVEWCGIGNRSHDQRRSRSFPASNRASHSGQWHPLE